MPSLSSTTHKKHNDTCKKETQSTSLLKLSRANGKATGEVRANIPRFIYTYIFETVCIRKERQCVYLPRKQGSHPAPASGTQTESNVIIMILYDTYTVNEHDNTSSFTTTAAAAINTTVTSTNTMKKTFIDPNPGQLQTASLELAGIQSPA